MGLDRSLRAEMAWMWGWKQSGYSPKVWMAMTTLMRLRQNNRSVSHSWKPENIHRIKWLTPIIYERHITGQADYLRQEFLFGWVTGRSVPANQYRRPCQMATVSEATNSKAARGVKEGSLRQIRNEQQKQNPSQEENHFGGC